MKDVKYEWDERKRQQNLDKHGVDFTDAEYIDWDLADTDEDTRRDYGETRLVTKAPIEDRLHVMTWCWRGDSVRIIGLRKANKREIRSYDETIHST